jgi:Methyltransferase domain
LPTSTDTRQDDALLARIGDVLAGTEGELSATTYDCVAGNADAAAEEIKEAAFALIDAGMQVEYDGAGLLVSDGSARVSVGFAVGGEPAAALPAALVEEIYWSNFYAHANYDTGSTFFEKVQAFPGLPRTIIDLGCGDGRDSYAFGKAGHTVVGLDRSEVGVRHATKKAHDLGHGATVSFSACDVGDAVALRAILDSAIGAAAGTPVTFYARFFLHSIPEDVQETMMRTIAAAARPGDVFAAEFRTDKDAASAKVHTKHYRRFQNGPAFGVALQERYGFGTILDEQEGTGLSPYKGEDPELYRVVARRD